MTQWKALTCSVSMIRLAVMAPDPCKYLPLDKSDVINTRAVLALGYPALAPFIQEVLEGDDHQWKYWCIVRLIGEMTPAVAEQYRIELFRLAVCPTLADAQNELNEVAKDALQKLWPCEYQFRSTPLLNNHEEEG